MRLHRFYTKTPIEKDEFDISDRELAHQWRNVFRYNVGSQVILFDGSGIDYLCLINSIRSLGVTLTVIKKIKAGEKPKRNVWLCVGLVKKDNFELIAQKATELGVCHIVPVMCERSEKKNLNMERLEKIVIEASEQSGRGDVPKIYQIQSLKELLDGDLLPNCAISMSLEGEELRVILADNPKDIAVFIGSEGGWSENETNEFTSRNIKAICLGSQVLRAETAAIAISSLLLL